MNMPCATRERGLIFLMVVSDIELGKGVRYWTQIHVQYLNPITWTLINIGTAHRLSIADIWAKLFVNSTRGSKDIEQTRNTVIQCLILDCDLYLEMTLVKHRHCTSSHHSWHLCKIICKSHQGFKSYIVDTKYSHTMFNLRLWPWPWNDLDQTYTLFIDLSYLTFVQSYL